MERHFHAAFGVDPLANVAAHLERRTARGVGHERQSLKIEHQFDVLFERIRHADRSRGQRARHAAGIVLFSFLNAPLDFANVFKKFVQPAAVGRAQIFLQHADAMRDAVQYAALGLLAQRALLGSGAVAEQ